MTGGGGVMGVGDGLEYVTFSRMHAHTFLCEISEM